MNPEETQDTETKSDLPLTPVEVVDDSWDPILDDLFNQSDIPETEAYITITITAEEAL